MSIETMTKLATYTVGADGIASITFNNIPQTYTDLRLVYSLRNTRANDTDSSSITINDITVGTGLSLRGSGSAVASFTNTLLSSGRVPASTATANTFGSGELYFPNYTSNNYKSYSTDSVTENNNTQAFQQFDAMLFPSTAPITKIAIFGDNGNLVQHSTATLYGIKNAAKTAGNSIKAIGGNITFDGTYVYHSFNSSGTFTPTANINNAEILMTAGGGAGGWFTGGGGGAGGLVYSASNYLRLNNLYTVTVGAGGASAAYTARGNSGSDSSILTYTAKGGGGGGTQQNSTNAPGGSGGSGGGAGESGGGYSGGAATQTSGTGFVGYGNAGGSSLGVGTFLGGGGGGAGASGANATNGVPGAGGNGLSTWSSWGIGHFVNNAYYLAGGGGAVQAYVNNVGAGGYGGGGVGVAGGNGTAGMANTGGGGGAGAGNGGSTSYVGGAGGSGIVIIRYKG